MSVPRFVSYLRLEKNYSVHTVNAYEKDILSFVAFCADEHGFSGIDNVEYPIVRSWVVALVNSGISNRSVNRKVAALKAYYGFLQQIGVVETNPLAKHKALKTSKKIEVPFSEDEMRAVLSQLPFAEGFEGRRDKLIIELLYTTGIRRAELVNIKVGDVDLGGRSLKVLGKRNKERVVPLLLPTVELFRSYLPLRDSLENIVGTEFVFLTNTGNKIYETLVYRIINKYFREVSSKVKRSPHILRHTFATHLLNNGADLNSVKELLGHSSLASTQVYTHNSISELKKIHESAHPRGKKSQRR
ncbi:MAG: integrase [Maribacter sp.]|nr:MAG: integrase [Maribacter sp.]